MSILTIGLLGLKMLLRDRSALFFVLVFPVVITALIGFAIFKNLDAGIETGVVNLSGGSLGSELAKGFTESKALAVRSFDTVAELRVAVRRDDVKAGVVIPADYDSLLRAGKPADVQFLASPRAGSPAAARSEIAKVLTQQGIEVRSASFASDQGFGTFDENLVTARRVKEDSEALVTVETETLGTAENNKEFSGFNYTAASNLILFMFITSLTAASQIIEARQLGISNRQLAGPVSSTQVMLGQMLSRFVIALFQGLFILGVGILVFDVKWGDPLGAGALIVTFALVATGVAMLFGSILRTPQQAGVGVPLGIGLGMLGGCMWPLEIVSPTMRTIGHLTPHAWAMDGFIELIGSGGKLVDIAPQLGVLLAIALTLIVVSGWRFKKSLVG